MALLVMPVHAAVPTTVFLFGWPQNDGGPLSSVTLYHTTPTLELRTIPTKQGKQGSCWALSVLIDTKLPFWNEALKGFCSKSLSVYGPDNNILGLPLNSLPCIIFFLPALRCDDLTTQWIPFLPLGASPGWYLKGYNLLGCRWTESSRRLAMCPVLPFQWIHMINICWSLAGNVR